jgi:hypothetical protein
VFRALGRIRVQGQLRNSVLVCGWSAGYVFFFPIPSQLRIFSHRLAMRRVYARLAAASRVRWGPRTLSRHGVPRRERSFDWIEELLAPIPVTRLGDCWSALAMQPIQLDDEAIEILEAAAIGSARTRMKGTRVEDTPSRISGRPRRRRAAATKPHRDYWRSEATALWLELRRIG